MTKTLAKVRNAWDAPIFHHRESERRFGRIALAVTVFTILSVFCFFHPPKMASEQPAQTQAVNQ